MDEHYRDLNERVKKLEDFILSKMNLLLELANDLKIRVSALESKDSEFISLMNSNCNLKDKEIEEARKEAVIEAKEHADNNHKQTMRMIIFLGTALISLTIYFNQLNRDNELLLVKTVTNSEHTVAEVNAISTKMDKFTDALEEHKRVDDLRDNKRGR